MIDIVSLEPGLDMGIFDTETSRASNILSVQLGTLEYAQDLGVDLNYFLNKDYIFQNQAFKSYLLQRLSSYGITVSQVTETVEALFTKYTFNLNRTENFGLIAR